MFFFHFALVVIIVVDCFLGELTTETQSLGKGNWELKLCAKHVLAVRE